MADLIDRQAALDCFPDWVDRHGDVHAADEDTVYQKIEALPSAQPDVARDIATIIENEKDMRVITDNNLWYQRGYEDGFREGRTRAELLERFDDDLK